MKKARSQPEGEPKGLTHNPFAALRPKGDTPAPAEVAAQAADDAAAGSAPARRSAAEQRPARLVVQREKKGRAGKTVTRVSGLELEADALAELSRAMKRALGCGAAVEGPDILLQGALTERAAVWLRKRFDSDVTIGN